MANIKSMKKDIKRSERRRLVNQSVKSSLKTYVKRVRQAATSGDAMKTQEALSMASKMLDKAAQRGIIHKNQAARRKARIAKVAQKPVKA